MLHLITTEDSGGNVRTLLVAGPEIAPWEREAPVLAGPVSLEKWLGVRGYHPVKHTAQKIYFLPPRGADPQS